MGLVCRLVTVFLIGFYALSETLAVCLLIGEFIMNKNWFTVLSVIHCLVSAKAALPFIPSALP